MGLPSRPTMNSAPAKESPNSETSGGLPALPTRRNPTPEKPVFATPPQKAEFEEAPAPVQKPSFAPSQEIATVATPPAPLMADMQPVMSPTVEQESSSKRNKKSFKKTSMHDPKKGKKNKDNGKVIRYVFLSGLFLLCGLGIKSAVFPPQTPSTDEIASQIQSTLGTTGFPRESAEGFVLSFAKAYFSDNAASGVSTPELLGQYASSVIISDLTSSVSPVAGLAVKEGPYIAGVREIDANNAFFTVKLLLSNGKWTYIEIPVQWNNDGTENSGYGPSLSISGIPTLVPSPSLAEVQVEEEIFTVDKEATTAFTEVAPLFFTAWAQSNMDSLSAFTVKEGSNRVAVGLQGSAIMESVSEVRVSGVLPGVNLGGPSSTYGVREARVKVNWVIPGTATAEAPDNPARYSSEYLMALTYDATAEKWVIFDIRSAGLPQR